MNYEFDEGDYAPESPEKPSGGLARSGSFGSSIEPYVQPVTVTTYLNRINPNLMLVSAAAAVCVYGFQGLIAALGSANPNNQLVQTQQIQAEAYKQMMASTTEALKATANQRPSCIAIVCNLPADQASNSEDQNPQAQPGLQQPMEPSSPYVQASAQPGLNRQQYDAWANYWRNEFSTRRAFYQDGHNLPERFDSPESRIAFFDAAKLYGITSVNGI